MNDEKLDLQKTERRCCSQPYFKKWREMDIWPRSFYVVALINYICLTALAIEPLVEIFFPNIDPRIPFPYQNIFVSPRPGDRRDEGQTLTPLNITPPQSPPPAAPTDASLYTVITRTLVFLLMIFFQNLHVFFGIFSDNIYELYATMVTQVTITVIILLRTIFLREKEWDTYSIIILIYALLFQIIYIAYIFPLYKVYNWSLYKNVGADPNLRTKYKNYLIVHVILKLDCMASLINILVFQVYEGIMFLLFDVPCGLAAVVFYFLGRAAITTESNPLILSFWVLALVEPVFLAYGLYEIINRNLLTLVDFRTITFGRYNQIVFAFLFVTSGIFMIVVRLLLVVQSVVVYKYFGQNFADLEKRKEAYWQQGEDEEDSEKSENFYGSKEDPIH